LIARTGDDQTASFLKETWQARGVDISFVREIPGMGTGVSVGLVDSDLQPRFIHTPGANGTLDPGCLEPEMLFSKNISFLHVAGYFVLPGLLTAEFAEPLAWLRKGGVHTSLDVVTSPAMSEPGVLWSLLPHLDLFTCNLYEAELITGSADHVWAARQLGERGARAVIIKLGSAGCYLYQEGDGRMVPGIEVENPLDTTGAGDAFAAGLLSGLRQGQDLPEACRSGNLAGAQATTYLGAVRLD
jgi:sugar/nucleoside kinase (ribokinase family)